MSFDRRCRRNFFHESTSALSSALSPILALLDTIDPQVERNMIQGKKPRMVYGSDGVT